MMGLAPQAGAAPQWRTAAPGFPWEFPRDHWAHPDYRIEWWYFTGHLADEPDGAPRFGYQFTVFRLGLSPEVAAEETNWTSGQLLMAHAALSDLRQKRHRFAELVYREHPDLAGFGQAPSNPIAWSLGPPGTGGKWTLEWHDSGFAFNADAGSDFAFELRALSSGPPLLQGPGGLSPKSDDPSAASLYYSFPRMATEGTITLDGRRFEVTGESWMDKEFSSGFLSGQQSGWDWFSLRLEDGNSLMLYQLRRESGEVDYRGGTVVDPAGTVTYLGPSDWEGIPLSRWTSPATGGTYPVSWKVSLPRLGLELAVDADFAEQENVSDRIPSLAYWEGSVTTRSAGTAIGRGYLEMTGYVPEGSLPLQVGSE